MDPHLMGELVTALLPYITAGGLALVGFILREKNSKIIALEYDVQQLKLRSAVQEESNRHRDERSQRIEDKLDQLLELMSKK